MNEKIESLKKKYPIAVKTQETLIGDITYTISEKGERGWIISSEDIQSCVTAIEKYFKNKV